jgi:hypothetical protein
MRQRTILSHLPYARVAALVACSTVCASGASSAHASSAMGLACSPAVRKGVLPTWARSGFSEPTPRAPLALGRAGNIVAIQFASALMSPAARGHNNKILWVSRLPVHPLSDLYIAAQRMVGTRNVGTTISRVVKGGPGPSKINLPAAGCWRLTLHWSGHADSVDLRYKAGT